MRRERHRREHEEGVAANEPPEDQALRVEDPLDSVLAHGIYEAPDGLRVEEVRRLVCEQLQDGAALFAGQLRVHIRSIRHSNRVSEKTPPCR